MGLHGISDVTSQQPYTESLTPSIHSHIPEVANQFSDTRAEGVITIIERKVTVMFAQRFKCAFFLHGHNFSDPFAGVHTCCSLGNFPQSQQFLYWMEFMVPWVLVRYDMSDFVGESLTLSQPTINSLHDYHYNTSLPNHNRGQMVTRTWTKATVQSHSRQTVTRTKTMVNSMETETTITGPSNLPILNTPIDAQHESTPSPTESTTSHESAPSSTESTTLSVTDTPQTPLSAPSSPSLSQSSDDLWAQVDDITEYVNAISFS
ncbi:hypothetical protein DFH29DRAFT_1006901 [Suillus ampliporus]|nr:hypothetical protein DFH29DRAFT_1006901 [Suillus ampliporus]